MTTINRMRQVSKIAAQQDVHVVVRVLYRYRSGCRATAAYNSNNYKQATRVTIIVIKSSIDEQSYRHRFQTIGLWDLLRINGNSFESPTHHVQSVCVYIDLEECVWFFLFTHKFVLCYWFDH